MSENVGASTSHNPKGFHDIEIALHFTYTGELHVIIKGN
jgi:hypothetical protein